MNQSFERLLKACLLGAAAIVAGCQQAEPDRAAIDLGVMMDSLSRQLQAEVAPPRENPFQVRPYVPRFGDAWNGEAVAYGCYREGQAPGVAGPSEEEIREDLAIIARHWPLIRVYGADGDTRRILQGIARHDLPIKVMLGLWLQKEEEYPAGRTANIEQVLTGIELATDFPDIVTSVCVGNETQVFWSGHRMSEEALIRYIRAVRQHVAVPVTTADDHLYWNKPESRTVAAELDFVTTHMHPLWNGKTLAQAMPWVDSVYYALAAMHPDRAVIIGETGWATEYDSTLTGDGEQGALVKAKVGLPTQAQFLIDMHQWLQVTRVPTFLFEAFDEPWKGGGAASSPAHIEKHWGVYYESRMPKESFLEYLSATRGNPDQDTSATDTGTP